MKKLSRKHKIKINKAEQKVQKRLRKQVMIKKITAILILGSLLASSVYALPDRDMIQELIYEHKQITMKVDIIYKLLRDQYLEKWEKKTNIEQAEKYWENFLLGCGVEESVLKEREGK